MQRPVYPGSSRRRPAEPGRAGSVHTRADPDAAAASAGNCGKVTAAFKLHAASGCYGRSCCTRVPGEHFPRTVAARAEAKSGPGAGLRRTRNLNVLLTPNKSDSESESVGGPTARCRRPDCSEQHQFPPLP